MEKIKKKMTLKDVQELMAIEERLNSYQFRMSQQIFAKRISLNLTRKQAAKLAGLSVKQYTEFEQGINLAASENEYRKILNKLSQA